MSLPCRSVYCIPAHSHLPGRAAGSGFTPWIDFLSGKDTGVSFWVDESNLWVPEMPIPGSESPHRVAHSALHPWEEEGAFAGGQPPWPWSASSDCEVAELGLEGWEGQHASVGTLPLSQSPLLGICNFSLVAISLPTLSVPCRADGSLLRLTDNPPLETPWPRLPMPPRWCQALRLGARAGPASLSRLMQAMH